MRVVRVTRARSCRPDSVDVGARSSCSRGRWRHRQPNRAAAGDVESLVDKDVDRASADCPGHAQWDGDAQFGGERLGRHVRPAAVRHEAEGDGPPELTQVAEQWWQERVCSVGPGDHPRGVDERDAAPRAASRTPRARSARRTRSARRPSAGRRGSGRRPPIPRRHRRQIRSRGSGGRRPRALTLRPSSRGRPPPPQESGGGASSRTRDGVRSRAQAVALAFRETLVAV